MSNRTKQPPFNLDREFIKWFYEQPYPDVGQNRWGVMSTSRMHVDTVDYWMRQAYKAGAEAMWHDIDHTLLQYATAVEGCDPELLEPCEVFDRARENLWCYVYNQLELF